jgi:copper chaperone CopZ
MKAFIKYFCFLTILIPTSSLAEIKQIILKVAGLDGEFCAYSLGKRLTSIEGVQEAKINIANKSVILSLRENKTTSLVTIESLLKNTPFKIEGYKIVATGKIEKTKENNFVFSIAKNPYKIYLMPERDEIEVAQSKTNSFGEKLKNTFRELFASAVKKLTPSERLHNKIKECYDKNADVEIVCNVHQHRNGCLLGLANEHVRLCEVNPKWLNKNS